MQIMIVFVILHYNEIDYTNMCIKSIRKKVFKNYKIIVVDNKSPNLTGEILEKEYRKSNDVEVILNSQNYGFSKGNNIGCERARKLNPNYICVLNNDVEIVSDNFLEKIEAEYNENKFHLLGPIIWNTELNYDQNYFQVVGSKKSAKKRLVNNAIAYYAAKYNIYILYKIFNKVKSILKINDGKEDGLHGACLIFSKDYFQKYEKIFLEKSFMYYEENFLNFRKVKDSLIFKYSDKIKVFHHESVSTKKSQKNKVEKIKFVTKNMYFPSIELYKMYCELEGAKK